MPPFGVLWDMDGVLVDTTDLHYETWAEALAPYDIDFSRATFAATFGMNNDLTLDYLFGGTLPPAEATAVGERKEVLFRQLAPARVELLPGVRGWLERLHADGIPQAVASSAPPANIDALVDALAIRPTFDALVSGTGMPGKPAPDVFLTAAKRIGLPPDRCIVVEDSVHGVEAARAAGMACLAVTNTASADALAGASRVVASLADLPPDAFARLVDGSPG